METFVSRFFSTDIRIRAALIIALFIIIFWWGFGKIIIRFVSFLPYLLRVVFKRIYLLIEIPVCWIHDRAGSFFHDIDNGLACGGDKIDTFLKQWFTCWRYPQKRHIVLSVTVYCVLLIWICIPWHAENADEKSFSGQSVYLSLENKLMYLLETHNLYREQMEQIGEIENYGEPEQLKEKNDIEGIVMKVITQKDPLCIRDIPSTENCEILKSIEKESTVFWKGDMAFGSGSNGNIEPWIKVETLDGTTGWARLKYLCPENEREFVLKLQMNHVLK